MSSSSIVIPESATTVAFTWNAEEHVRALRAIFRHLLIPAWIKVLVGLCLGILAALVLAAVVTAASAETALASVLPWVIIAGLWILFVWQLNPRLNARAWAKRHVSGDKTITQRFTPQGLETSSDAGTSLTRWHVIRRVVETESFLLLYLSWQYAVFVPKRALSPEQFSAIRARLEQVLAADVLRFRENIYVG
jgi:hypothetical protein